MPGSGDGTPVKITWSTIWDNIIRLALVGAYLWIWQTNEKMTELQTWKTMQEQQYTKDVAEIKGDIKELTGLFIDFLKNQP